MGTPLQSISRRLPRPRWLGAAHVETTDGYRLSRSAGVGYADPEFPRNGLIRLVDHPELLFRTHLRDVVKAGRTALVVRAEVPLRDCILPAAYKRVRRRTPWKVFSGMFGGNRTLRTWRTGRAFVAAGVPTARPLAVVVPRWFRPHAPSYILTEWVYGGENLTQFAARLRTSPPSFRRKKLYSAAEALGRSVGRMHSAGFSHRDLKSGNLLLAERKGELRAFVIDLDGAAKWRRVPDRVRVRNLARLAVAAQASGLLTNTARLRFLKAYLSADAAWKPWWRRVRAAVVRRRPSEPRP